MAPQKRIKPLLRQMRRHQLEMYIVPLTDEHLNEYVPEHRQRLKAVTGFSGSAGTAIFCCEGKHALFIDSRYYLQAEQETDAALFEIHKLGMDTVLEPQQWLEKQAAEKPGLRIGIDPFTVSCRGYQRFQKALAKTSAQLLTTPNLIDKIWKDAPPPPQQAIYLLDESFTGVTSAQKLAQVREKMGEISADLLILTALDEIAWITNLRGSDIHFNPVFEAYAVISQDQAYCFCHNNALSQEVRKQRPEWTFRDYTGYAEYLQKLEGTGEKVWLDFKGSTQGTRIMLPPAMAVYKKENPIVLMKAIKNPTEVQCIRIAHQRSACAKIRSFVRLEQAIASGKKISEKHYADWLYEEYTQQEGFADLSFEIISAAAEHGAIVHYSQPSQQHLLQPGQMLLVDSGIQCHGGTTDDTRTVIIGLPDERQKFIYTQVLKAHIHLARQVFPEGTSGTALDAIARSSMWNAGLDYGHGTGHGVGAFLNVHEGPQKISSLAHEAVLKPSMIVSNEPGYYEAGWGGIRLENLYLVIPVKDQPAHPGGKQWLGFEPLTLIPFDQRLMAFALLSAEELQWLKSYHTQVFQKIAPLLTTKKDQQWLQQACHLG